MRCIVWGFKNFLGGLEVGGYMSVNGSKSTPTCCFLAMLWSFCWREMSLAEHRLVSSAADFLIEDSAGCLSVFVAFL